MWNFVPKNTEYKHDYAAMAEYLNTHDDFKMLYKYGKEDLFFLIYFILDIRPLNHPWFVSKVYDIQENHNNTLDLWSRELFKSTIMSFALPIWEIINNPEERIGIFSNTKSLAKDFLRRIKHCLETNELLQQVYPNVFYDKPQRQSPKWSLDINTPVLTVNGWKKHGDLEIGDKIFGSKGQIITVIGNSGVMQADCRKIIFDDCEIIASSEHLWPMQCARKKINTYGDNPEIRIFNTDKLPIRKKNKRMLPTPVIEFNTKNYELNPYILGLWLGDGTAGTDIITFHNEDENEGLNYIKSKGFEYYVHRKKEEDNFSMYGIRGLKEIITKLGCIKNKYIPECYLYGDRNQRLELLQGLMDSDGTCKGHSTSKGMCMFSNTNKKLADGVFYLASSLGLRPGIYEHMPKERGKKKVYQVYFVGLKTIPPFKLKRKLNNCKEKRHKTGRYVKSIEKINSVPVNCIKVDAEDHLYLAGHSLVPTHNSEDDGLLCKRKGTYREMTVEACGITEGSPVGSHYTIRVYDDIVTWESTRTADLINKTRNGFELSHALGTKDGTKRVIGTRYDYNDQYSEMLVTDYWKPRIYRGDIQPSFWTDAEIEEKRLLMGTYNFSCQISLSPVSEDEQKFSIEDIKWETRPDAELNVYIFVDPAGDGKKDHSSYTVMWAIGIDEFYGKHVLDIVRDKLDLHGRWLKLAELVRKHPDFIDIGYEKYSMQGDLNYINRMKIESKLYFKDPIPLGGKTAKDDRIRNLVPYFQRGEMYFPKEYWYKDWEGKNRDLIKEFLQEEFVHFPNIRYKDMLDCLARIDDSDLEIRKPGRNSVKKTYKLHSDFIGSASKETWMSA